MKFSHDVLFESRKTYPGFVGSGGWSHEVRCGEGTDVFFVVCDSQVRQQPREFRISVVKLPEKRVLMWVGWPGSLDGTYRLAFGVSSNKPSHFFLEVDGLAEPWQKLLAKPFKVDVDGVRVDELIHYSGDVLIRLTLPYEVDSHLSFGGPPGFTKLTTSRSWWQAWFGLD